MLTTRCIFGFIIGHLILLHCVWANNNDGIIQTILYDESGATNPSVSRLISVVPQVKYDAFFDVLLSDMNQASEYIEIKLNGVNFGICEPNKEGTEGKCFFHDCMAYNKNGKSIVRHELISENGTIHVGITSYGVDAPSTQCVWEYVKTYTVVRITLIPSGNCSDGIKNGNEMGVDCGNRCANMCEQIDCGDLTKTNSMKCDGEANCYCKGDYCLAGGDCSHGYVFLRGKPIGNTNWDNLDQKVLCQQLGFWKPQNNPTSLLPSTDKYRNKYEMNYIGCEGNETSIEECDHQKFDWIGAENTAVTSCDSNYLCSNGTEKCAGDICFTMYSEDHCDGKTDCKDGIDEAGCSSVYLENSGACRNQNRKYYDIGSPSVNTLLACQQKCDATQGCGAVSWDGNSCYMTSEMASTTAEKNWKCYKKGPNDIEVSLKSGGERCNATVDRRQKIIISPNYPKEYGLNLDCQWLLKGPVGKTFIFHFEDFKTEDCHDGISIYDGNTVQWWKEEELRSNLCGDSVPGDVATTKNIALIRFSSDESITNRGFKLTYTLQ